jgi:hypothetical protein
MEEHGVLWRVALVRMILYVIGHDDADIDFKNCNLQVIMRFRLLVCALLCAAGGNTDPGTASGTYSFTITATTGSGASAFTTTSSVSVTVE